MLDSIHLEAGTSDDEETQEQQHDKLHPMDLRSCVSEPFLRLQDSNEDLGSSSELLLSSRLDSTSSLATSTEEASSSSSSGSVCKIIEEEECKPSLTEPSGTTAPSDGVPAFAKEEARELDELESWKTASSEAAHHPTSSDQSVEGSSESTATKEDVSVVLDVKIIPRRNSEGDLKTFQLSHLLSNQVEEKEPVSKQISNRKLRYPLLKSISLNTANEQDSCLPVSKSRHLTSNILNSSIQTLVGDEPSDLKVDILGGGGDSGIDPGEAEVFKFPPKTESCEKELDGKSSAQPNGVTREAVADEPCEHSTTVTEEGNQTPICASPTFLSAAKPASPCGVGNSLVNGTVTRSSLEEEPLPDSQRFDSPPSSGYIQDSFVTPHGRCSSPYTQSCASSEFSFHLPSPSYPWAPPSSPINLQQQSSCLLYTSPSPRDATLSRMPSSA